MLAFRGTLARSRTAFVPTHRLSRHVRLNPSHCLFSSRGDDRESTKKTKKKKWKVNPNIGPKNIEALTAAFDELARKDGFDPSESFLADEASFEDAFDMENLPDAISGAPLNPDDVDLSDFSETRHSNEDDLSMEERIAQAQKDAGTGSVSVPEELDEIASDAAFLKSLGFRREVDPFGDDETPRKEQFTLVTNAMTCTACGSDFQCDNEQRPGFLPPEKYEVQTKLAKIEELQKLQEKAETSDWTPEDEVKWLLQTGVGGASSAEADEIDIDAVAKDMGLDLVALSKKPVICKRCHGLQNFGKVDNTLRPGWTTEPLLSQEKFRELLHPIGQKKAVIIALVDVFDFTGSVLPELDAIAGDNPVILAANKVDLLPSKMGPARVENWVRRELEYLGIKSLAKVGGAVRLISCKTGQGVAQMLDKARSIAEEMDCDVYVVGSANAGKSTLINNILRKKNKNKDKPKIRAGNVNAFKGALTTSPLPGTTLKFIKINLGEGRKLFDTPGLLVPGTITQILTPEELKIVVPKSQVEPVTFRVASGKCVLVGGLAKIEVIGDSKPFLLTFFVANDIKLHPTDSSKADEFIAKHAGGMLCPPLEPGPERMEQIGEFVSHDLEIEGEGWKEAAADITLRGLGWIAVTGAGTASLRISVPKGIGVTVRPPLMPFDIWETTAKYTGGRSVRKSSKSRSGKRRKGVGRN